MKDYKDCKMITKVLLSGEYVRILQLKVSADGGLDLSYYFVPRKLQSCQILLHYLLT